MKKAFYAMFAAVGMYSCSAMDEPQNPPTASDATETGTPLSVIRTPAEATACAMEAFAHFYGTSRSVKIVKDVKPIASRPMGRSAATDTSYYIVNLEDNEGYAVIAADRRYPNTVLAVTEKGNVEHPDSIDNPGAAMFFEGLNYAINGNFERDCTPIDSSTIILPNPGWSGGDVNPWLDTPQYKSDVQITDNKIENRAPFNWGQANPEGKLFPNHIAGCANVATALVFSYFEHPQTINYSNTSVTVSWPMIKNHTQSYHSNYFDICDIHYDGEPHTQLAKLCYAIGIRNHSTFDDNGTGATTRDVHTTVRSYYPNCSDIKSDMPDASKELGSGIIVVSATETEDADGHMFIIDGYNRQHIVETILRRDPGERNWKEIKRKEYYRYYNHINWGWDGADNGYFQVGVFNTRNSSDYDGEKLTSVHSFKYNFRYFVVKR